MKTIIVCIEWPTGAEEQELEIEDDATEDEIAEAAKDAFFDRCNYGFRLKE